MRKREENTRLPYKLNADSVYMIFNVTSEKKERERWKMERNKHHWAGRASCFIWRIEAQYHYSPVITQESRVREKKTRPFLPLFLHFFIYFTWFLSPSTSYISLCSLSVSHHLLSFVLLVISFWFALRRILRQFLIHLQAPKGPQHTAERDHFSLFGGWNKLYCWCEWWAWTENDF